MAGTRTSASFRSDGDPSLIATNLDRQLLAIPGRDGTLEMLWRSTGIEASSSLKNGTRISELEFLPDGRQVAIGSVEGVLQVWDLAGASPNVKVFQHEGKVQNALFTKDGKRFITISTDSKAFIWDAKTGQQVGNPLQHDGGIYACDVSQDGQIIATASGDKTIKIWDATTGKQVGGPLIHESPLVSVAISPDSKRLVSGGLDGTVAGWEIKSSVIPQNEPVFSVQHNSKIRQVVFAKGGEMFASASSDGFVRCWDSATGLPKFGPFQHDNALNGCDFLPDGKRIVTCGFNGSVYVWDLATAQVEETLRCGADVRSVIASKDGRILTNENPGVSRVWHEQDGKFVLAATARNDAVGASIYSQINPESELLAVVGGWLGLDKQIGDRGAAFLWDLENDSPFCPPLYHFGQVVRVQFDSSGSKLLTASADNTAKLWTLERNDLPVSDAKQIAGLYAQLEQGADNTVKDMSSTQQASEFARLSKAYPKWFSCSADEIAVWNDNLRRIRNATEASQ